MIATSLSWNIRGLNDSNKKNPLRSLNHKWRARSISMIQQVSGNRLTGWTEFKAYDNKRGIIIIRDKKQGSYVDIQHGTYSISSKLDSLQKNSDGALQEFTGHTPIRNRRFFWHKHQSETEDFFGIN